MGAKTKQRSALLIIGNEILSGRTMDKNGGYIAEQMTRHGVPLSEIRVVPDIEDEIVDALNTLRSKYDFVFTTGGIGPTHDDITSASVAKALGLVFGRHEEAYQVLLDYYGPEELTDARATMADMPEGAALIPNPVSGAPGFQVENVFVMAGVPRIMQAMLNHVITKIAPGEPILSNTVGCDLVESVVAQGLGEIQEEYPDVDIGSYPNFRAGKLTVSVVIKGTDEQDIRNATKAVRSHILEMDGQITTESYQVMVD